MTTLDERAREARDAINQNIDACGELMDEDMDREINTAMQSLLNDVAEEVRALEVRGDATVMLDDVLAILQRHGAG